MTIKIIYFMLLANPIIFSCVHAKQSIYKNGCNSKVKYQSENTTNLSAYIYGVLFFIFFICCLLIQMVVLSVEID